MKKNSIFKVILITLAVIVLLSCFVETSVVGGTSVVAGGINSIGIIGIAQIFYNALINNLDVFVLVVMVGVMYGVLNKTDAYQQLISTISNKFKGKEKIFVILSMIFFASIASVFGWQIELFVIVPFVSAVIMFSGYDKKTAFSATIGSILIGTLGSILNSNVLGVINSYYGFGYMDQIIVKIFILCMSLFLFVTYVLKHAVLDDVEYLDIPNYTKTNANKRKKLPVVLYLIIISLLVLIGTFKLGNIMGIEFFTTLTDNIMTVPLMVNIFGEMPIFGSLGYIDLAYVIFIGTLIIGFIYGVKFDDMIDGMYDGARRVLPASVVLLIVSSIPIITLNYPFYLTIVGKILSLFDSFNIFIATIATFVISVFVPNISIGSVNLLPILGATSTDINASALIVQTIYGLVMLVAPTSALLMFGLTYYKIGYGEWIKYILKTFLYILIILMATFIIIMLI